mgnify:CR=1 FL=1
MKKTYAQVNEILAHTELKYVNKIPQGFLNFLRKHEDQVYRDEIRNRIATINVTSEAKAILATLYRDYWCSDDERKRYVELLKINEEKYQQELSERYSYEKLFEKKKKSEETNEIVEDRSLIIYKKETIFTKILNKIKNILGLKNKSS